jgi:hypothetical protein
MTKSVYAGAYIGSAQTNPNVFALQRALANMASPSARRAPMASSPMSARTPWR